jgi:hypothetical protein
MPKKKKSIFENILVLVLLGVVAGAIGGLGLGVIQTRSSSSSSTAGK